MKKNIKQAGVIVSDRKPDMKSESSEKDEENQSLMACAKDLHSAVQSGNIKGIADALQAAFQECDKEPHEEGPHIEPHSYAAQNQEAGE